jgi:hypothetical protein
MTSMHKFLQRIRILLSQKPEELPLDVSMEAHFAADKSSTTYRRILAEWGLSKDMWSREYKITDYLDWTKI